MIVVGLTSFWLINKSPGTLTTYLLILFLVTVGSVTAGWLTVLVYPFWTLILTFSLSKIGWVTYVVWY